MNKNTLVLKKSSDAVFAGNNDVQIQPMLGSGVGKNLHITVEKRGESEQWLFIQTLLVETSLK